MESPRVIPADKVDIPTETSDQTSNLVSEIPSVDPSKISQDSEINDAKAINHENSRIPPEASVDVQDLSETTKSDRKSTGEAEETQSQQAQQVKSEEDNGEGSKSSDNQAAENLPEIREAEEVPQEAHQSSESQENISQENVENKENNKSEPQLKEPEEKVQEQEIQPEEKTEEKIEGAHVDEKIVVEENNEVPQSENVVADVEQSHNEVKEEPVVVNTEVKNEEQPIVESQPIEEPQEAQNEEQISEPKVENCEVQEPAKEPEAPIEEIKPVEEVPENKVEEQNNNTEEEKKEPVQQVEDVQPVIVEEQNNIEEIKPVEEVSENKIEEQNNTQEEVVKAEEIQEPVVQEEQKPEPVVEQQKDVFDFPVQEEAKPVEPVVENKPEEQNNTEVVKTEEIQAEPVVEQQKGVFDFPVEATQEAKTEESNKPEEVQKEQPAVAVVEEKKEEPVAEEIPKETRSPKLKNLRINTQQNNVVTRIINYCAKTGEPLPDASVAESDKKENSAEQPSSQASVNSEGSSEVKKHYDTNQSLTDLLKPINMEEPQASPIIKRNATSTTCLANPPEENKEEAKEAQQPASAMIQSTSKARLTMDDFQKITSLGRGSYGEVFLVKKIANGKLYALKSIDKNFMKKEKKEHQVYVEREVLMKLNHPNIIKLVSSFQDKTKLYFVLEYVSGGEFSDYLRVNGKLTKEQVIFFSAEIINILEYLHTFGIAHRDMKPENLLLTQDGHIKCIDFGTARFLANDKRTADLYNIKKGEDTLEIGASAQKKNHRSTFVGTAQYVSPEMLEGSDCGAPADLWALGCMIYLMTVGQFPFIDINEYLIFQKIKAASVKYPEDMDSEIKDIIQKLLVKEPNARLGAGENDSGNGYAALKGHPLFKNTDFATLNEQKPPVIEIASPHKKKSHDIHSNGNSNVGIGTHNNRKVNSEDLTKPSPAKTGQAFNFQAENQTKVILSGLVLKKCGWLFYKPRQLILNNKPRLVYYDPDSNQLKGEIPLAPTTKAELESKTKFIVNCPNKKFVFKEMEHSAERWVEIINKTVEQLYAKKPDQ